MGFPQAIRAALKSAGRGAPNGTIVVKRSYLKSVWHAPEQIDNIKAGAIAIQLGCADNDGPCVKVIIVEDWQQTENWRAV